MKISTKGRYGLRAIINLAGKKRVPVLLKDIAKEENLSEKYLEAIFALLKKANIVKATRGQKGGYSLARKPESITIIEILEALEGSLLIVDYSTAKNVLIRDLWVGLNDEIRDYLKSKKLSNFIVSNEGMYFI